MTRGAVIGLLALAALVGGVQALTPDQLAAIGEPLLAAQDRIAADTSYVSVSRMTASPGCLWTKVDVVNTYDACDGASYDYNGLTYGAPVTLPLDTGYYSYNTGYTDTGSWNQGVPTFVTDTGVWGGYLPASNGNGYYNYVTTQYTGASNMGYAVPTDSGSIWAGQSATNNVLYSASNNYLYTAPLNNYYGSGYGTTNVGTSLTYAPIVYQDTWYTEAFPGVGTAIIPILPPIFQPTNYYTGYSITPAQSYGATYYPQQRSTPTPSCVIQLSPTQVAYGGSTVISWASSDATSAALEDYGTVPLTGSKTLNNQTASRTIGLSVSNGAKSGACYALLQVGPAAASQPRCVISGYPDVVRRGQSASIAWKADNATSASLSGYGTVPLENGRTVTPNETTTYILTVSGNGRSTSCSTTIVVQ